MMSIPGIHVSTNGYKLEAPIDSGRYGAVYRSSYKPGCGQASKPVAVKVLPKLRHDQDTYTNIGNIKSEIHALETLRGSKNVVGIVEAFQDEHNVYIVQEYCKNGTLDGVIRGRMKSRFTEHHLRRLASRLLGALAECHANGIYHGDVKPTNILLTRWAEIKLADFGNSIVTDSPVDGCYHRRGTPWYAAPEIFEGRYGYNADIWAVGIIMYGLMFKAHPFYTDENFVYTSDTMHKLLTTQTLGCLDMNTAYSKDARRFVRSLLDPNASSRLTATEAMAHPFIAKPL